MSKKYKADGGPISYLAAILHELAGIARGEKQDLLVYLIEMAALEAGERAVQESGQVSRSTAKNERRKTRNLKRRIAAIEEELEFTQKLLHEEIDSIKRIIVPNSASVQERT